CWTSTAEVHCSLVDEQGKAHEHALALPGQYPTIVARPGGWAVGYAASESELFLQLLTPALGLVHEPVSLKLSAQIPQRKSGPLLTPTPSGFALVGAALEDGHDGLLRLDADLQPAGAPVALGRDLWFAAQLDASDTRALLSLSVPYAGYLLIVDGDQVTAELGVSGGGKVGMAPAVLLTDGGFGAAWLKRDWDVLRRFFGDGHDAEIGLATRSNAVSPIGLPEEGFDSYQQLLHVGGKTLLVARSGRYGGIGAGREIRAGFLTFP
ncbi:MAG: hypothetical protein ABW061_02420, partial [Polyangiaceae bacterium]